jgi:hypothetical protein
MADPFEACSPKGRTAIERQLLNLGLLVRKGRGTGPRTVRPVEAARTVNSVDDS